MKNSFGWIVGLIWLAACGNSNPDGGSTPLTNGLPETKPPAASVLSENEKALFAQNWTSDSTATSWAAPSYAEAKRMRGTSFEVLRYLTVSFSADVVKVWLTCETSIDGRDTRGYKPTQSSAEAKIKVTKNTIEILETVSRDESMFRQFGPADWARDYRCHASLIPAVFEYTIEYDDFVKRTALKLRLKSGGDERRQIRGTAEDDWALGPLARSLRLY